MQSEKYISDTSNNSKNVSTNISTNISIKKSTKNNYNELDNELIVPFWINDPNVLFQQQYREV